MDAVDIRGGADRLSYAHSCKAYEENSPFVWLDDHRILAVALPNSVTPALLDQFGRPFTHAALTAEELRGGTRPTASVLESGTDSTNSMTDVGQAVVRLIDIEKGTQQDIAKLPLYPFQGALTLSISPDSKTISVLVPIGAIPPNSAQKQPHFGDEWQVQKKFGIVSLLAAGSLRWVDMPKEAKYPVEMLGWSPDGARLLFRARAQAGDVDTPLFKLDTVNLDVARVGDIMVGTTGVGPGPHDNSAFWVDDQSLLVNGRRSNADLLSWWLVDGTSPAINLTATFKNVPNMFRRAIDGRLFSIADDKIVFLDPKARRLIAEGRYRLPKDAAIAYPYDNERPTRQILITSGAQTGQTYHLVTLDAPRAMSQVKLPPKGEPLDLGSDVLVWSDPTPSGSILREISLSSGEERELFRFNEHLADVRWGRATSIDYVSADGKPLIGEVILPPDYHPGLRYPTLVWVYGGYVSRGIEQSYWLNPYMPGLYNLQLYAAHGYVVLIPSMPMKRDGPKNDSYEDIPKGVLPAIDKLVELGIADGDRLGVFGQSYGGYSVYSLITQTHRFKAAVAMAGVTDLAQAYLQFDPLARGYQGIEHMKSVEPFIMEVGNGMGVPPYEDQALYWRNSPIAYVDRVETPLMLIHGELDMRGAMAQAETFFYGLYRQGKKARLLRYWGESHSLAQSPANIRDIVSQTLRWFDQHLLPASTDDNSKNN
ncbi:S9 family peptidase [Sphingobium sp. BHU LFT2]|uniref:alpha/beta hydrolase family protein n=1 Tax=Sphingobium sp. BHU LFT2 TaxID=2807634 RepID=UPI001BE6BA65|nr:prolyl oligopeptidase family serine peptidase [Sphingobium sp. BHU LFT2]MBT2244175.1 S9 family peptidase [Sphingobium sp. BHU LFT2]